MISVLISTLNDEAVLGRALMGLTSAAVGGLVSEVIVADGGSTDATLEVADDAGCTLIAGEATPGAQLRAASAAAKRDWLLVLDPAAWLQPGWEGVAQGHIDAFPGRAAYFPLASEGLAAWVWSAAAGFRGQPAKALLTPRPIYDPDTAPKGPRRLQAGLLLTRRG